jgi:tetratricopeptide (TPR) repeat protein
VALMGIRGSLHEASLPDVLQLLAMGKKTGCLSVTHRDDFGYIYFDRGRITFASIVNRRDRIGDLLVNAGALTRQQLDEALAAQRADPSRRLGDVLLGLGLVAPEMLHDQVRVQIEEAVYYLFTWSHGSFTFEPDVRPEEQDALVSINPESLLLEGARRVDEWSQIAKKVPSFDVVFDIDAERLRHMEATLTPAQQLVLELVDGRRDVRAMVDTSGLGEFEVGQALFALVSAGVVRRAGRTRAAEPAVSDSRVDEHRNLGIAFYKTGMLDEALREFRRVAELRPADPRTGFYIGLVLMRQGKWPAAADVYRQAASRADAHPAVLHNLAYTLERLGRFDEADGALERAVTRGGGDDPRVRTSMAALALRRGAIADAEAMLRGARPLWGTRPPTAAWYHYAGLAAALMGDLEGAASVLTEGVRQYPRAGALYANLAVVHERRGAHGVAASTIERGLQEDATRPQLHKAAGDQAYRAARYDEALEAYERAARLQPTLGSDVHLRIGNLRYRRGEIDHAQQAWARALELDPNNGIARSNLDTLRRLSRVSA